jgi:hypothetical protein
MIFLAQSIDAHGSSRVISWYNPLTSFPVFRPIFSFTFPSGSKKLGKYLMIERVKDIAG